MIGSILTRGMTLALGYLYPAYECFKSVEKNRPEMEHLRFWCEYWMIIALVTVLERVGGDALISWLPLYSEAKLAFIVYLWYPQTKGTTYVYATFVRPFVAKYEQDIDGNLGELKSRAGEIAYFYWQRSSTFFQSRFLELLQFLASQSPTAPYAAAPPPPPPPSQQAPSLYPPRLPPPRTQSGGGAGGFQQPSAPPQPPPGYPAVNQQGPVYPAPGGAMQSGPYPTAPAGMRPGNSGGSNQWPAAQTPAYPPRSRSVEDEEFEIVDKNNTEPSVPPYVPEQDPPGPNGYLTRSRHRAMGDRARGSGGSGSNLYFTGGSG